MGGKGYELCLVTTTHEFFIRASHRTNCFMCYGMSSDKTLEKKAYRVHIVIIHFSNPVKLYKGEPYSSTLRSKPHQ